MTVTLWSGSVPVDAQDIIDTRVERVARRAVRHGFPAPRAVYGDRRSTLSPDGITSIEVVGLAIEADGPLRLGQYKFIGTVSSLGDGTPFVTFVPGERTNFLPLEVNHCDHCNTYRQRNDTYLVTKGDATYQVGSSCILDFTGHSPAAIVGWLKAVDDLSFSDEEIGGWGRSATRFYDPKYIIGLSSRLVSKAGYISKQKAEEEDRAATAEVIRSWLSARGRELTEFENDYPVTPESEALYDATMLAIANPSGNSEWLSDIVRLASSTGVQWRHVGILGSAVILGLRAQERRVTENRPESSFFGEVGQRLTLTDVKVILKRSFEGNYGTSFVIRMDVGGNDALWFASWSSTTEELNEGDIITIVATVKGHEMDSRSGRQTTVLTRCNIRDVRVSESE